MPSHSLSLEQTSAGFNALVHSLAPGDEIVLTDHDEPVARVVPTPRPASQPATAPWKGKLELLDEGDETILNHFKDYIP